MKSKLSEDILSQIISPKTITQISESVKRIELLSRIFSSMSDNGVDMEGLDILLGGILTATNAFIKKAEEITNRYTEEKTIKENDAVKNVVNGVKSE